MVPVAQPCRRRPPLGGAVCAPSRRSRRSLRSQRGVTLLELMAVVTIIGIFLVLAYPSMSGTFDEKRAGNVADDVAGFYRIARTRSAATGAAHAVVATAIGGGSTRFDLLQAVDATTQSAQPSCFAGSWTVGSADMKSLGSFNPATDPRTVGKNISVTSTATSLGTMCYSPGGTMWNRTTTGGVWRRPTLAEHLEYQIFRTDAGGVPIGLQRFVRIGTTGVPRVDVQG